MTSIIFLLLIAILILCIIAGYAFKWASSKIKEEPLTIEELGENLCDHCPLEDNQKGSHLYPSGHYSCEGCRCEDAYEYYLEDFFNNDK